MMNERFIKPYRVVEKSHDGKVVWLVMSGDGLVRSSALDKRDADFMADKYNHEVGR